MTLGFRKRTAFNKMGFNDKHIPFQGKARYVKEKQRLPQWDSPLFNWPPKMPRPTMHRGRALLNHIDSEER